MSLIRLRDCSPRPWRNGLGSTREIAVYPCNADSDSFLWRVSIAAVDSDAPFSSFPGVDRHIALLQGAGFRMTLDGHCTHALDTPFAPFGFAGEAVVATALIDGPTRDFNLMVRRTQARGTVETWREAGLSDIATDVVLIYCAAGEMECAGVRLQAGDAWRPTLHAPTRFELQSGAVALAVRITAK